MSELSRLRWRCRRGMKELDVILSAYLENRYAASVASEKAIFETLLELEDPELFPLIMGKELSTDPKVAHVIDAIRRAKA